MHWIYSVSKNKECSDIDTMDPRNIPPNRAPNAGINFAAFLQRMHLMPRPRVPAALWNVGPRFPPPAAFIVGRRRA